MKQVKDFFTTNDKLYVYSFFSELFWEEPLGEISGTLQTFKLEKDMQNVEILYMIKNRTCTFADIAQAIQEEKQLLKNGYVNIFYVKKDETAFAVSVYWHSEDRKWDVSAWNLVELGQWDAGCQVFCPGNAETPRPSDPVTLSIDEIVINGVKYIKA